LLALTEETGLGYNSGITQYVAGYKLLSLVLVMVGFERYLFQLFEHTESGGRAVIGETLGKTNIRDG
jgi:hypothetical protein